MHLVPAENETPPHLKKMTSQLENPKKHERGQNLLWEFKKLVLNEVSLTFDLQRRPPSWIFELKEKKNQLKI